MPTNPNMNRMQLIRSQVRIKPKPSEREQYQASDKVKVNSCSWCFCILRSSMLTILHRRWRMTRCWSSQQTEEIRILSRSLIICSIWPLAKSQNTELQASKVWWKKAIIMVLLRTRWSEHMWHGNASTGTSCNRLRKHSLSSDCKSNMSK